MDRRKLILASASPRRRQFLTALGIPYRVVPAQVDETPEPGEAPEHLVARLARAKALAVARRLADVERPALVLSADTVVALEGRILGKPERPEVAAAMLRSLRGRAHQVHSALALVELDRQGVRRQRVRVHGARVWMRDYTEAEIQAYVASGDPLDKAGGYAIQHPGFRPVIRVEGCAAGVMGFPLAEFVALAPEFGLPLPEPVASVCQELTGMICCLADGEMDKGLVKA